MISIGYVVGTIKYLMGEKILPCFSFMVLVITQQAMFVHKLFPYDPGKGRAIRDKVLFIVKDHNIDGKRSFIDLLENEKFLYKVVKNAGHGVNHEQPAVINREVVDYLLH